MDVEFAFILLFEALGDLSPFSGLIFLSVLAFSFFGVRGVFESFGVLFDAELLRRLSPWELDDSESLLDEFEPESLELTLDDVDAELVQLELVD